MGSSHMAILSPPALVDSLASGAPNNVWVKIAASTEKHAGAPHDITWAQVEKAVDSLARWIELEFGPGNGEDPIAYIGINDVRYPMVIIAALKAGYKVRQPARQVARNLKLTMGLSEFSDITKELALGQHSATNRDKLYEAHFHRGASHSGARAGCDNTSPRNSSDLRSQASPDGSRRCTLRKPLQPLHAR